MTAKAITASASPFMETIFPAIIRLSDCLLASHPDTPREGTVPEMMDAAVEEIERLRAELDTEQTHNIIMCKSQGEHFAKIEKLRAALVFIVDREDLMFAECTDAEEIIAVAKEALA